jgi:hypothetical protein
LMNVLYPDNKVEFPTDKNETTQVVIPEQEKKPKPKRKFRRARSVGGSSDDDSINVEEPVIKENIPSSIDAPPYKGTLYDEEDEFSLTSSDCDSSSSEDFPHSSPKRKQLANDNVIDKMERVRMRLFEMDMEERKKKGGNK